MKETNQYVLTFFSHYDAVQFSRRAKAQGIEAKLMPVPRKLSSSCGTGAQAALPSAQALTALVAEGVDKIYRREGEHYSLCYDADEA